VAGGYLKHAGAWRGGTGKCPARGCTERNAACQGNIGKVWWLACGYLKEIRRKKGRDRRVPGEG
jgi:hypothetical protein